MKRLLAYLFVVLGLGIYFNDHVQAKNYCIPKKVEYVFQSIYIFNDCYIYHKKVDLDTFVEFALTHPLQTVGIDKESPLLMEENLKWLKKYLKENNISSSKLKKSIKRFKIANSKSSQTQKVAKKKSENLYIERMLTKQEKLDIAKGKIKIYKCSSSTGTHFQKDDCIGDYYKKKLLTNKDLLNFYLLRDYTNTQIAKAESNQTQRGELDIILCDNDSKREVIGTYIRNNVNGKCPNTGIEVSRSQIASKYNSLGISNDNWKLCYIKDNPKLLQVFFVWNTPCRTLGNSAKVLEYDPKNGNYFYNLNKKTQIAKAEPNQTQKVAQSDSHLLKPNTWVYFITMEYTDAISRPSKFDSSYFLDNEKNMKNYIFDKNEKLFKYKRIRGGVETKYIRISKKLNDYWHKNIKNYNEGRKFYLIIKKNYLPKVLKELIDEYTEDNELKEGLLAYFNQEKPTITPKKKVKVAKVEDPKQEEFKPENKEIDNDAPVIEIAQNIIVSDTSYVIEGKVSDKSDKIFVEIDGQPIEVKKGKFKANRYSPVDEQIKIVAIDQWGNKSKPKLVNIKIKLDETAIAEKLEPLNPSNIKTKSSKNKIAIIIGIENYAEAPKANYANLDAQYFFDYARRAFGVKKQNINLLINEDATVVKTDKALSLWLKSKIKKNRSELIIFFAGHGLASTDGKELYLLPQDGNPDRLKRTALSRTDLFREIIELNPKSVTMFLDTCYSGVSRDEQMLLASARPLRIVADEQEGIPDNFTIFSASKLDQISSGLTEVNHGIFSYYLMKGLEGYADFNEDKKITNGELLAYMDENVSQKAAEQGREQNPSLAGDPDKVLISYR